MFGIENLRYKDILEIDHLTIPGGKIVCIYGESGSGKSTLLRLLNNMESPSAGKIFFHGEDIESLDPIELRRRVTMLPQTPVLFGDTVLENLQAGLRFAERPHATSQQMEEALAAVGLPKALKANAYRLSGGEKQRLALARLFLLKPEVFLLDEPSASLDAAGEDTLIADLVHWIKSQQRSLIMVTHTDRIVQEYAEYTIGISRGKVTGVKERGEDA